MTEELLYDVTGETDLAATNGAEDVALSQLSAAWRTLAEAKTLPDLASGASGAELLRQYAKRIGAGLDVQNEAAEIKLRFERKAGLEVAKLERSRGGRPRNSRHDVASFPTLGDRLQEMGLEVRAAQRWQREASVTEDGFEQFIADVKATGDELTTAGLLRAFRLTVHFSSEDDDWHTPPEIIERVVSTLGAIDLDPCSNAGEPNVPAARHYTADHDGLSQVWTGRVYMNPPYGKVIWDWVEKLHDEYECGNVSAAVALVPARTDTGWWKGLRDCSICFIEGRLSFSGHRSPAPFPSAAAYFGPDRAAFVRAFDDAGDIWVRLGG